MKRHIWCRTKSELLHGRVERAPDRDVPKWQRLFGLHRQGRITLFDLVELPVAHDAFEQFLASPKEFAVEAANGVRIDFAATQGSEEVSLDIWFSDSDLSEAVVTKTVARELLTKVFFEITDAHLSEYVRSH